LITSEAKSSKYSKSKLKRRKRIQPVFESIEEESSTVDCY
jgi:hypothetical protein